MFHTLVPCWKEPVMKARRLSLWLSLSLVALVAGAGGTGGRPAAPQPPEVEAAQPVIREVADYEVFTGRVEASAAVQIKARVSGFLDKVCFKDGGEVKKGDILFQIDPRPYRAELEKAEAALALEEVRLKRADALYQRGKTLLDHKGINKAEHAKLALDRDEAQARVRVARAGRDAARLKLDFTQVTAPVSGRVGQRLLDPGNLVRADDTALVTITTRNPMHVSFDLDRDMAVRLLEAKRAGKASWAASPQVVVGLAGEKDNPWKGKVDFVADHMDPKAETLRLRAVLSNANERLVPGLLVRVALTTSEPSRTLLVPRHHYAWFLISDAEVFIVNDKNKVEKREVRTGLWYGDLVAIKKGLRAGERVVLKGPEGLQAGMTVKPKQVRLPAGKK